MLKPEEVTPEVVNMTKKIMHHIAFNAGKDPGKQIKELLKLKSGPLNVTGSVQLAVPWYHFNPEMYRSLTERNLIWLSEYLQSKEQGVFENANYGVAGVGLILCSQAVVRHSICTIPAAHVSYKASLLCSVLEIGAGLLAGYSKVCQLSKPALLGDVTSYALLKADDTMQRLALEAENRKLEVAKLAQMRARASYFGRRSGASFGMPPVYSCGGLRLSSTLEKIPFDQIGKIVGNGLTVYFYVKMTLSSYRCGKRLYDKYKIKSRKKLLLKQAKFSTTQVFIRPSFPKRRKLYFYYLAILF